MPVSGSWFESAILISQVLTSVTLTCTCPTLVMPRYVAFKWIACIYDVQNLDTARFEAALKFFPSFFRGGGWLPIGATYFYYHREIPMRVNYEIRMSLGAWDEKWVCSYLCKVFI